MGKKASWGCQCVCRVDNGTKPCPVYYDSKKKRFRASGVGYFESAASACESFRQRKKAKLSEAKLSDVVVSRLHLDVPIPAPVLPILLPDPEDTLAQICQCADSHEVAITTRDAALELEVLIKELEA